MYPTVETAWCPSTDEWAKTWNIHTICYYSAHGQKQWGGVEDGMWEVGVARAGEINGGENGDNCNCTIKIKNKKIID